MNQKRSSRSRVRIEGQETHGPEADGVEEVGEVAAGDGEAGEAAGGCGEGGVEAGEVAEDEEGVGEGVGSGEREWSASKKDRVLFMNLTTLVDGLEDGIVEGLGEFGAVGEGEVGDRVVEELVRGGGGGSGRVGGV